MAEQDDAVQEEWLGFSCPNCHSLFRVASRDRAEGRVECPQCGATMLIPGGSDGSAQADDPPAEDDRAEGQGEGSVQRVAVARRSPKWPKGPLTSLLQFRRSDEVDAAIKEPDSSPRGEREEEVAASEPSPGHEVRRVRRKFTKTPVEDPAPLDWEMEDGHKVTTAESMAVVRPLILAGGTALVIIIVTGAMLMTGPGREVEEPRSVPALPVPPQPPPDKVEELANSDLKQDLKEIEMVAQEFLAARSVEEMLPPPATGAAPRKKSFAPIIVGIRLSRRLRVRFAPLQSSGEKRRFLGGRCRFWTTSASAGLP